MAVYKIFPIKDATIYSLYPNRNTGLDEIIESSTSVTNATSLPQTSRFLLQFDPVEINDIINNKISGSQWQANFKAYVAVLEGLNLDTKLEFYPISGSWNMGTGKYNYSPEVQNGVSWNWRSYSGSNTWLTGGYPANVTASYSGTLGGGNWYYSSSNTTVLPIYSTQSFGYTEPSDINTNITNMVKAWYSGTIENNGLIVKQAVEFIDNENYQIKMQYFSRDTHTIYPPQLEFRWRDYVFNTGSSTTTILNTSTATLALNENPGVFYPESINKFRVNSRPTYPARVFQTSSYFTQNYYLPTSSYFSIKDLDTNEVIIDFDDQYTQLSADDQSSYFTLYMNGLEPERYYKILIKTIINGSTLIFDDNYYFKIING
jgi:hypothetical protein